MIKEEIKFQDSCVFEGMTSIRAIIKSIDEGISNRRIEKILYDEAKLAKIAKEIGYFKAVSNKYGFVLLFLPRFLVHFALAHSLSLDLSAGFLLLSFRQ